MSSQLPSADSPGPAPGRRIHPLAWFWIYTGMRLALLLVIFAVLWLCGLGGFVGAAIALLLTIPLSYVLLARPRAAMVASMDQLRAQRRARTDAFDELVSEPSVGGDADNDPLRTADPSGTVSSEPRPSERPSTGAAVIDDAQPRPKNRS